MAEFYADKWFKFTRKFKSDTFHGILLAKKEGDSEWVPIQKNVN